MAITMEPPIEKVTTDDINRRILRLLSRNDPEFTSLTVMWCDRWEGADGWDEYCDEYTYDDGGLEWLGYFLSGADHVKSLTIKSIGPHDLQRYKYEIGKFFEGVSLNKSITTLEFELVNFCGYTCFEKLIPLFRNNKLIEEFCVENCNLSEDGGKFLASILSECQGESLSKCYLDFDYFDYKVDDEDAARIIAALCMHSKLENLYFKNIQLGRKACVAIANLVQNSAFDLSSLVMGFDKLTDDDIVSMACADIDTRKLKKVHCTGSSDGVSAKGLNGISSLLKSSNFNVCSIRLPGTNFDDENAVLFAQALANNSTLEELEFRTCSCTSKGWHAISQLLCNTSSIKKTTFSNHSLKSLDIRNENNDEYMPQNVRLSLRLNRDSAKTSLVNKILIHHPRLDMKPFFEWDFKLLPVTFNWFERARVLPRNFEADIDGRKLSSIYQFVRGMPDLYIDSCLGLSNKKTPATKKPRKS